MKVRCPHWHVLSTRALEASGPQVDVLFSKFRLTERLRHPSLEVGTSPLLSVGLL